MANGLNYNSSNVLSFTTNDVKREVIDASGNHGFGVLSPTNLVDISGSTSTPLRVRGLADGTDARILATNANGVVSYRSDVLVGGSISDNVITLTETDAGTTDLTVQAVTAVTYNDAWDIALTGTGTIGSTPIALPFITGGTYSSGTITLGINGDSSESNITITGIDGTDTFITSGTYTQSTGVIALGRNDGQTVTLTGTIDLIESGSIADNLITLTDNKGNDNTLQINAIDDLSYDSSFGLTVGGTGTISSSFELPFITGGTLDIPTGQLSLVMNGGLESDITISGFATSASDTFVTGATFSSGTATLTRNDGNTVDIAGIWTNIPNSALVNQGFTLGSTVIELGDVVGTVAGLTSVTSTTFVGELTGNADTATALASGQNFSISGDITASAVSFDGTGAVALSATIDNDAVVTDKILNGNVTNAKLANSAFTTSADGAGSSNNSTSLGGTLSFTSADNSAEIVANGAGVIDFSVNAGNISLFNISGDTGSVTPNGSSTITWVGGTGIDTSISGDDLTIAIDSSVVTLNGSQTLTNKTINASQLVNGSVTNDKLANSSLTLAGDSGTQTLTLGDTSTFSGGDGIVTVAQATDNLVISVDSSFVEIVSRKGASNGYASLDANGRVPSSQLPSSAFEYKGNWNASTNTPTLADGTGDAGDMYRVSVAGNQDLGSGTIDFQVGDYLLYNGAEWDKIDNTDSVSSVNGATGAVVLDSDDIAEGSTNLYDKIVSLSNGTGITTSGTYPSFTITNTDLGSTQNIFKTIDLPTGTDPVAGSNSDTLTFSSSDSSVTINGTGSNTIDITVGASVNTNIFNTNGSLTGARTVTQAGNTLAFTGGDFTVDGTTFVVDESASAVGIGVAAPAASAVLEVASTSKGFLFPRMTESNRTGISSPATGLMVYQTDGDEGVYIYKSFGWVQVI
jgi:hypothetical protein